MRQGWIAAVASAATITLLSGIASHAASPQEQPPASDSPSDSLVRPFLDRYCLDGVRLDQFTVGGDVPGLGGDTSPRTGNPEASLSRGPSKGQLEFWAARDGVPPHV